MGGKYQVWDQVRFKDGHDQAGKAGLIVFKLGGQYTVKLDDAGAEAAAVDDDLELLGR